MSSAAADRRRAAPARTRIAGARPAPAVTAAGVPARVALVGIMGSGKSTVGRLLARRLGWRFVDMDVELAREAGKSVSRLFADEGEERFRERECALLDRLSCEERIVVATGGGTVTSEEARRLLDRHFVVAWLVVSPRTAWQRIGTAAGRPLLSGEPGTRTVPGRTPLARLTRLAASRRPFYAAVGGPVRTTGRDPAAIAATIAARLADAEADSAEAR